MSEMRIDILREREAALTACLKLILTSPGKLNGRAMAEFLVNGVDKSYSPPLEKVCCGRKYIGNSCPLCSPQIGSRE